MMKKFALFLAFTLVTAYTTNICLAGSTTAKKSLSVSPAVYGAIAKYKQKNYTGCIQDLKPIVEKDENNVIAQYYLGIAYAQLGMKNEARTAYQKVVDSDSDVKLVDYSKKALACLDGRPECSPDYVDKNAPVDDDMTVFIKSGKFMHDDVMHQVQEKSLEKQKDRINNDMMPDAENYKYINDASGAEPTNEEIANAVRVLAKVGLNPFSVNNFNAAGYTNPQLAQLGAIMGNTGTNNAMSAYLPYIISQGSQNPETAKQMMQTMMMSQMMPEFGFSNSSNGNF